MPLEDHPSRARRRRSLGHASWRSALALCVLVTVGACGLGAETPTKAPLARTSTPGAAASSTATSTAAPTAVTPASTTATPARAGHSEHQLGTAVDFGDGRRAPWEYDDFAATPSGAWLAAHAWEYGFVMSYPAGKSAVTCYDYEPWHYRWVGRDIAARVRASGLTLRQYLGRAG